MKWIGQHIWDLISRFRGKVYIENLEGSASTTALVVDPDGQIKTNSLGSGGGNGEAAKVRLPVRFDETNGVSKGDPVYIKSYHGSVGPVIVAKADASNSAHMPAFGLADADYVHNADGYAISIGNLVDLNTSSYSVGDTLYVAVGGGLTNTKPTTQANLIQNVGTVARSNANNGQVEVVATGRSNDVPNLNSGNIFVGNSSNVAQTTTVAAAVEGAGNITIDGDLKLDGNTIKSSAGTVMIDTSNSVLKASENFFTNTISGYDNTDFELKAGGNIQFTLDVDNNETAQYFSFRDGGNMGTFTEIANLNQDGDLVIEGDLTVKGNQISGISLASGLTFGSGITTLTGALETPNTIYTNQLWSYGTDGDINIRSQNDINLIIDGNNNANRDLKIQRTGSGGEEDIVVVDEAGVMTMYGTQLGQPAITLQQNTQTATYGPPVFEFFRNSVNADNSDIGRLDFNARDSGGSETIYARILALTEETAAGNEGGQLRFQIASHDGEIQTGILIEDGDAEDEIDVTIANGSNSLTTVSGKLAIGGDLTGVTNFIDVKTAAYWSSSTSAIYVPISGATTSESTSLSTASYTTMFVVPFDGKVTRITSWNQGTATPATSTFELYVNGDDDPLSDQVGTDLVLTSYNNSMVGDCASDWVFTKGQTIAIRRTDSHALYGVTMSVVLEYNTTT